MYFTMFVEADTNGQHVTGSFTLNIFYCSKRRKDKTQVKYVTGSNIYI
jgi:hypothetical protein